MKLAPTVEVSWEGWNAPLQYRMTSEVLPTPCEPRTTILASRADDMLASLRVMRAVFVSDRLEPEAFVAWCLCDTRRMIRAVEYPQTLEGLHTVGLGAIAAGDLCRFGD